MSAVGQQLSLALEHPGSHAERVHPGERHGVVLLWEQRKSARAWTKVHPSEDLFAAAGALHGTADGYFSVNEFAHWRQVRQLRSLRAVYIDLDGIQDLDLALDVLATARMPAPSLAVFSGRGLHLYWLLRATPAQALPVWQRIQDTLLQTLAPIGSDPACRDCTRVLRLAGTINSKNDAETRGLLLTGQQWDLHTLADEVLGPKRAGRPKGQIRDFDAAAARAGRQRVATGSIYGWWHLVYRDLVVITDRIHGNRVAEGERDKLLFLHAVALSWFAQPDAVEDEILSVGRTITPFSDDEILRTMAPVLHRADSAAAGEKVHWNGLEVDPRYRFKAETLRTWVGTDVVAELADDLRALAPAEVVLERKRERDASRWSDRNTGQGYRASRAQDVATARLMASQGISQRQIATELGVSQPTVLRWLKASEG